MRSKDAIFPKICQKLEIATDKGRSHPSVVVGEEFKVKCYNKRYLVNLTHQTCTCRA